jgi:heme/copper-type cytochrome/quinol oxidase subunit 2
VRKGIVQLVAIGVVFAVIVTLVAVLFQWLPTSNSVQFDRIQDIYWFATIISIVIFSLVAVACSRSGSAGRRRPRGLRSSQPRDRGTAVPAILVTSARDRRRSCSRERKASENALQVTAIGQQFAWKFEYPDSAASSPASSCFPSAGRRSSR